MLITGNTLRHGDSPHFLWGKHLQCSASNLQKFFSIANTIFSLSGPEQFLKQNPIFAYVNFIWPEILVSFALYFWPLQYCKMACNILRYIFAKQDCCFLQDNSPAISKLIKTLERNGILLPKLFWPTVRKNCPSDREKLLKF